jgi:ABC-type Fe3+/spermidine/putrescine transport system ATPase subunit
VAEFLGMTNFIEGKVVSVEPLVVTSSLGIFNAVQCQNHRIHAGDEIPLLIRSFRAELTKERKNANSISGRVVESLFRGDDYKISLQTEGGGRMTFELTESCLMNEKINLALRDDSIICLKN